MEILKKDEEIATLKMQIQGLNEQYIQELSFCCTYSNALDRLQKEYQTMKNQYISKEEQYKKQLDHLQQKLYSGATKFL
eukprot:gene6735-7828_t